MQIRIESLSENPASLLRKAGNAFQREEHGEMSFIRPLARSGYPRFHCYATLDGLALTVSLHLDQKKHTYGETTRHHGEYENEGPLKEEVAHLLRIFGEKSRII